MYQLSELRPAFKQVVAKAGEFQQEQFKRMATEKDPVLRWMPFDDRVQMAKAQLTNMARPTVKVHNDKATKIIFRQSQSPGDILMLTVALRDLHINYPNRFVTDVRTPCPAIFENLPYITHLDEKDPEVQEIKAEYNIVHECNEGAYHFVHGFVKDFEQKLGIKINITKMRGDIRISDKEKSWYSQIHEILSKDVPFWIMDAGGKQDYTAKIWEHSRFQQVVDMLPDIWFVQVGTLNHLHKPLVGPNVINLLGKTDLRQMIRLMYHAAGVITPVSFPMHLAAAVEMKSCYRRKTRPCIVIAGGREPTHWEAYPNHRYLHHCGMLPCCDNGGCWKSRTEPIGDNDDKDKSLCTYKVDTPSGQPIPYCLSLITPEDVVRAVREYLVCYDYSDPDPNKWTIRM